MGVRFPPPAYYQEDISPWWRIVKEGGKLNEKFPGAFDEQIHRLEAEGHKIIPGKGKQPPRIADFES